MLFSCQRKYVCPAYQSAFVLDEDKTERFFSLFGQDSLPKDDFFVSKNKFGIIEDVNYRKRKERLKTIKMENVLPPPSDSVLLAGHDLSAMDSTGIDSLFTLASRRQNRYNRDQKLYMLAMDPYIDFEDPDEVPATNEIVESEEEKKKNEPQESSATDVENEKSSWWPFGKKNKSEEPQETEQQDYPSEQ